MTTFRGLEADAHVSSDYAVIRGGEFSFYYGYEHTDADDNWLFVATQRGKVIMQYTAKDLGAGDKRSVTEILMLGIARYFALASA